MSKGQAYFSGAQVRLGTSLARGRIFSCVRPFYEQAVSNIDRSFHRSLWVSEAHRSFIEGSHMTKNTASENIRLKQNNLTVTNALAYYTRSKITLEKRFC